ncbi:hypothetical protein RCC89_19285 [Cytophagaceae bacterium ABcell3]|nr:hypothetical protein RCC89_19285 [Cytophagaceae bacterium ABcell3]
MKKTIYLFILVVFASCAKLPIQTLTLTDAIISEGERMHELNLSLLNKMFNDKREKVDNFIKNEYTPKYLKEFKTRIPNGVNYEEEFPNMIQSVVPVISSRRDMMQSALESQRIKLIEKLNSDYKLFKEASTELRNLIESNIKVNEERQKAFQHAKNLTLSRFDLNQIETELDEFIIRSGDITGNINELNNSINSLLNN